MSNDRRNPHIPFDPTLIQDFLKGKGILSVELIASGKSNTNYKLVLRDGGTYVLRLYSQGDARRENYIMGLVKDIVPVPTELDQGEGWSVYTFLNGELLESVPQHTGAAAEALARISSVKFDSPGWVDAEGTVTAFDFGSDKGFVETMLEHADVLSWIGEWKVDTLSQIWDEQAPRRG